MCMWLHKRERRLLSVYYWADENAGAPCKERLYYWGVLCHAYRAWNLKKAAKELASAHGKPVEGGKQWKRWLAARRAIDAAHQMLAKRGLLSFSEHGEAVRVQLTLRGYDLGRKYGHWQTRLGLWLAENKKYSPIPVALGFLRLLKVVLSRLVD